MRCILSIAPSPYENPSNASFKFAIKAPGDEHNTILSGDAKFKGAERLQDHLKRTLSGRYSLHTKDRGKGRLAGKETIKGTFPKTPSSALYGFADSRPLPAALRPRLHPPGADRAADTRRSGRGLAGVPGSSKGEEGKERPARGPKARYRTDPRGLLLDSPCGRSEKAQRKIQARRHPSLRSPRLSARQSGLPPTNRCDSIHPGGAPLRPRPALPRPRCLPPPAQPGPHGASSLAAPRCRGIGQVLEAGGSPLGLSGYGKHRTAAGPCEQEDVQAGAGTGASGSRDARGRRPAASTPAWADRDVTMARPANPSPEAGSSAMMSCGLGANPGAIELS